jgi:hypothetical protein
VEHRQADRVDPVEGQQPMCILFLDIDGVLNRAGFQPEEAIDLVGWIEPELAARLDRVARELQAELVLASDWRIRHSLDDLRAQLARAGIGAPLRDTTPVLGGQPRWREIEAWMVEHRIQHEDIAIVDDADTMGPFARRHVRVDRRVGFDDAAAVATHALFTAMNVAPPSLVPVAGAAVDAES